MSRWDITGETKMNKDFKEIAKKLGIAIPTCLFSIGVVNAENTFTTNDNSNVSIDIVSSVHSSNGVKNEVIKYLVNDFTKGLDKLSPDHTNYHSNTGGDHVNQHANTSHTNSHSNRDAQTKYNTIKDANGNTQRVPYCEPHTNQHSNSGTSVNQHTNRGNKIHTNSHTDRETKSNC